MTTDFTDRFLANTYAEDQPVSFSVSTDSRSGRFSTEMPESIFARAISLGSAYGLHLLPTLELYAETSLTKSQCDTFLGEVRFILGVVNDPLLGEHLRALAVALEKCVRAPGPAAMLIEGP